MAYSNISLIISTLELYQDDITIGFSVIHLVFGVPGCFLNILLFSRQQFRTISCCTYFLTASVAMLIQLIISSVTAIYVIDHPNPVQNIAVFCKIWNYLQQALGFMSRWILALACLDRYALSSTNASFRRFASVHVARRVTATIVMLWSIFSIPLLILFDIKNGYCSIVYKFPALLYNAIFTMINSYVIPISVMIIFTLLIRHNLANKRVRRQHLGQQQNINDKEDVQRKRDHQALIMLFTQIIIYIVLTTPWFIFTFYRAVMLSIPKISSERLIIERFVDFLIGGIILFFPSASFYSYTLTSNMFRKELFIMLHSIVHWKHNLNTRRVEPLAHHVPLRIATI